LINTADDIIAALRSIIADYEQRLSGTVANEPGKAAPVPPAPQTPAGAATLSVEDMGREVAMQGRLQFIEFYHSRDANEQARLRAISTELRELFP
jgi:hypothetical protein